VLYKVCIIIIIIIIIFSVVSFPALFVFVFFSVSQLSLIMHFPTILSVTH